MQTESILFTVVQIHSSSNVSCNLLKALLSPPVFQDTQTVIETFKSGFEPPGDVDFEDFTQSMKRTVSDTSLTNTRADGKTEPKVPGKSRGKLWPFIKKNKVLLLIDIFS